ncbi:MAG: hypothetical protein FWE16_04080 [Firmicutes bacterium]|nr:hypothetical protein [Bacillota bacterium]
MGKKDTFRAFMGKDANKFYVFKNDKRRKTFKSVDTILKIIYRLALAVFFVMLALIAVGLAIFILSFVFIVGFTIPIAENPGVRLMEWSFGIMPIALIVFFGVYLLKFILEYIFLGTEIRELRKDSQTNKNYIDVGRAVIKSKLFGLLTMVVVVGILVAIGLIVGTDDGNIEGWHFALLGLVIVALIVNKIISTRIFLRVRPQISEIKGERNPQLQQPAVTPPPVTNQ